MRVVKKRGQVLGPHQEDLMCTCVVVDKWTSGMYECTTSVLVCRLYIGANFGMTTNRWTKSFIVHEDVVVCTSLGDSDGVVCTSLGDLLVSGGYT